MTGQTPSPPRPYKWGALLGTFTWGESYLKWASLSYWGPNALESLVSPESVYTAMFTQWEGSSGKDLTELASGKQTATVEGANPWHSGVANVRIP